MCETECIFCRVTLPLLWMELLEGLCDTTCPHMHTHVHKHTHLHTHAPCTHTHCTHTSTHTCTHTSTHMLYVPKNLFNCMVLHQFVFHVGCLYFRGLCSRSVCVHSVQPHFGLISKPFCLLPSLQVRGCDFQQDGNQINLSTTLKKAVITGNIFTVCW